MNQGHPNSGTYFTPQGDPRQTPPGMPAQPQGQQFTPQAQPVHQPGIPPQAQMPQQHTAQQPAVQQPAVQQPPAKSALDMPGIQRAPVQPSAVPRVAALPPQGQPAGAPQTAQQPAVTQTQPAAQPAGQPGAGQPAAAQAAQKPSAPARPAASRRVGASNELQEGDPDLHAMLTTMAASGASDLHLTVGSPPMMRRRGMLEALEGYDKLQGDSLQRVLFSILTQKQREKFEAELELDFSYSVPGQSRYRVNIYYQRESVGAAFRLIPYEIKSLESLGVPPTVADFAEMPRGMVLVTGPTGSGKSTTLAALVDLCNETRAEHIMTVEDPIEFLHRHKKALVNQREVGTDTQSFGQALKHVLRQDPDIILVGEMRDLDTISVALTAAETGHLVFATLHTQDAPQTIDRIIDVFPPEQQAQVRTQLAGAIQGVVSQTLCKTADGRGRVVATEVMKATPAIRNLIREGKTHQIYSALQSGSNSGMHTMDQHLAQLVRGGDITYEHGLEKCHNEEDYKRLTGRMGGA